MSTNGGFVTWLGQALVVGIGWFVVHRLSAARDRDKSRREMVVKSTDSLSDGLNTLFSSARDYHLNSRSVETELAIKMALQDLSMRVASLSEVFSDQSVLAPCRADIVAVRRAISGRHFEDEHEGPLPESDQQYQAIAEAVLQAKRTLLKVKHRQFPE